MISRQWKDVVVCASQFTPVWLNAPANFKLMSEAVEKAVDEERANLVVFPELANIGYITKNRDPEFGRNYIKASEPIPGPTTTALAKLAKQRGVYIVSGIAEQHRDIPGALFNASVLVGPMGEIIGVHRKLHIPGYEKFYFCPGHEIEVFKTDIGNIGITICYDGQFPELPRLLALKGAEIICMLWNMPDFSNTPAHLQHITATRALENRLFTVSCNRTGSDDGDISFFGGSCVSDPVGNILSSADSEAQNIYALLSADKFCEDRFFQPVFRDRRPELYAQISDPV